MPRITPDRFSELVDDALESLPSWVAEAIDNLEVLVEDEPPADQPTLLGLYEGIPKISRDGGYSGVMPDRITLFLSTILAEAGDDEDRLRAVILDTVKHEIAHHFGLSDEELWDIGAY